MKKLLYFTVLLSFLFTANAFATTINPVGGDGANSSLQDVLNDITVDGDSTVDAAGDVNDALGYDAQWALTASGGSVATMIIELAGNANINTFGVYDAADHAKTVEVFSGPAGAGDQVRLSIKLDGSVLIDGEDSLVDFAANRFGFYIDTPTGIFYSNTGLNGDQFDHMVAFQGNGQTVQLPDYFAAPWTDNEFILAWEDTFGGGDYDYQDLVLMVESVQPIPEPATMLLFGLGVLGMGVVGRKKLMK